MRYCIGVLAALLMSSTHGEELVAEVELAQEPLTVRAERVTQQHLLAELHDPGIATPVYALRGMVRYENVAGDAFFQLDNDFGERGTFFTKSLAENGPLAKISGSSDWRPFLLPFYANSGRDDAIAAPGPKKLTLTLHLPGEGTVSVADVALYQYASGDDPLSHAGPAGAAWFDNRTAGLIGAVCGVSLGLWGALIGVLASRGKARLFAVASANALLVLGIVTLVFGGVALAAGQPYAVYYTLLLIGGLVIFIIGLLRRNLGKVYEAAELKQMRAMDV